MGLGEGRSLGIVHDKGDEKDEGEGGRNGPVEVE